jgi:3-oxoadipate enol-lactonase
VPFVTLAHTPLAPDAGAVELHVRTLGTGTPLLVLHGGWGYEFYRFDVAIAELAETHRFVIPDRTGYGKSPRIAELPARFHHAAAIESERVLDALAITRCAVWGHSDGAVIAAIMALRDPARISGIVLEALHVERVKPRSRAFFTMMAEDPDGFGPRVAEKLAAEHGESWRDILRAGGRAWLAIAATPADDYFDHRLGELRVPALVVHGVDDPRTEPGELDRVRREVPHARFAMIEGGQHSPHSERAVAAEVAAIVAGFLRELSARDGS